MADLPDSMKEAGKTASERFSDPFLFATAATWACINWRFFVTLLHDGAPGEPHAALLKSASDQLVRGSLCAALGYGLGYALAYPFLSLAVRLAKAKAQAILDAQAEIMKVNASNQVKLHTEAEELFSRTEWEGSSDMSAVEAALNAMVPLLTRDLAQQGASPMQVRRFRHEPFEGFGVFTPDNRVQRPRTTLSKVFDRNVRPVYVCASLAGSWALIAVPGSLLLLPRDGSQRPKFEFMRQDGRCSETDEAPTECLACVRITDEDSRWGILEKGAPAPTSSVPRPGTGT